MDIKESAQKVYHCALSKMVAALFETYPRMWYALGCVNARMPW